MENIKSGFNEKELVEHINDLSEEDKIDFINKIKLILHKNSPFCNEPVDCVLWVLCGVGVDEFGVIGGVFGV